MAGKRKFTWYEIGFIASMGLCAGICVALWQLVLPSDLIGIPVAGVFAYGFYGREKYGPRELLGPADLKAALVAAATWPYLTWKDLDSEYQMHSDAWFEVMVNGVFVGTISDDDYRAIKRQVLRDTHVYVRQVFNLGRIASTAFDQFMLLIPALIVWGFVALACFAPAEYEALVALLRAGPDAIRSFVLNYYHLAVLLYVVSLVAQMIVTGHVVGFRNEFDSAINLSVRQMLRVAADGELTLSRCVDPVLEVS
jgi:hypothetical protein